MKQNITILIFSFSMILSHINCNSTAEYNENDFIEEKCGDRRCLESKEDGYYNFPGFPEYYFKEVTPKSNGEFNGLSRPSNRPLPFPRNSR